MRHTDASVNTSNLKSLEYHEHGQKQELKLITDSVELIDNQFGKFDLPIREEGGKKNGPKCHHQNTEIKQRR